MNTQRSIEPLKVWEERESPLKKGCFTTERTFRTSQDSLFALICPTREYDWIPGWSCDLLHSDSGYAEYGTVTGRWVISTSPLSEDQNQGEDQLELGRRQFEMLIDVLDHYVHTGEMRA